MALSTHKITDNDIATKGVVAAPTELRGTATQNKQIFDRLIREAVKADFNALIDALEGAGGAAEIGASEIEGLTGETVQALLQALKTLADSKAGDAATTAALALKTDETVSSAHFKAVSLDSETGVFTFTREDGSAVTIDTPLEKVVVNFSYEADRQCLVLELPDGSTVDIALSAFITETEFVDSEQIDFSMSNHTVTATIKAGSITDSMLSSALTAMLVGYVTSAAASATAADASEGNALGYKNAAAAKATEAAESAEAAAEDKEAAQTAKREAAESRDASRLSQEAAEASATESESWAVGGTGSREGEDTNNAQYYAGRAAVSSRGLYAFTIDFDGHLIVNAADSDIAADFSINADGHLVRSISGGENDLGLVRGADGRSAYASAQTGGYTDTQAAFYADLAAMQNLASSLEALL